MRRELWTALGILTLVTGLVIAGVLAVSQSRDDGEPEATPEVGSWYEVQPPPGAPEGTRCWVWQYGILDNRMGGPACFEE